MPDCARSAASGELTGVASIYGSAIPDPCLLTPCGLLRAHDTTMQPDNMQHPCDAPSWSSVIDKAKLVYAVGWYNAQHNVANVSAKDHLIGSSPSFCQAVNLSQQPVRSKSYALLDSAHRTSLPIRVCIDFTTASGRRKAHGRQWDMGVPADRLGLQRLPRLVR